MKIKRLSIHGFKSFVEKTNLVFASGASAVIGPNGCGKSNIVDAIRWVLGEQNARHLRGKEMQDVIFNGSESRKPLGMAEVVLTFANEDGLAPARFADFTEIEIARRLYRSGESEYFINKVPSRLRDIVDLFTDTGIGTRAYSIIEQGQIGWLINARPEDRRVIFEEAAGINKFKHKKDAALRRLESSKENLTRVSDIISEVKRQLNSLNRQAKKAERYKLLREELKVIELRIASMDCQRLAAVGEGAAKRMAGIKDEELALFNDAAGRESALDALRNAYGAVEDEYKGIRDRLFALEKELQAAEQGSALSKVRIEEILRNEVRLGAEIAELQKNRNAGAAELERLRASIETSASFIETEDAKLEENEGRLAAIAATYRAMEEERAAEAAEALKANSKISELKHAIQTCLRDEDFARMKEAKSAGVLNDAVAALTAFEQEGRVVMEALAAHGALKDSIAAEMQRIKDGLAALEARLKGKKTELEEIRGNNAGSTARLETLEEMERKFENIKGGAKSIMSSVNLQGIRGLLADCIEANAGFEKAVEAALGDRLQFILVESQREGVDAIEFLKSNAGGRGSFVPFRDVRPALTPLSVQVASGTSGVSPLLNVIRIKEGYDAIVNGFLADTYIVDTLDAALNAWRENGAAGTFVTLDGETIDAQGIITGGVSGGADSGILQRRAEIKRLKAHSAALVEKAALLEANIAETLRDIESTAAALAASRDKLHASDMDRLGAESRLARLNADSDRITKSRAEAERDMIDAGRRLGELSGRKAALAEERVAVEALAAQRDARIAHLSGELLQMAEKKEEVARITTEIKVALAQARERAESLRKEVFARERQIIETDGRMAAKAQEIEAGAAEVTLRGQEVAAIKLRLDELLGDADSVRKNEVSVTERLGDLATAIKDAESVIKDMNARQAVLAGLKGEVSIELKETELAMNNLKEKAIEKYGVAIETYSPAEDDGIEIETIEPRRAELREKIAGLGEVSLGALEEFNELERRHQFLVDQQADLQRSVDALMNAITRINRTTRERFAAAFEEINARFKETFPKFFNGGRAELRLAEDTDVLEAGVEIVAQPPGKRLQNITLLSGGEKALTATSLIFAIFLTKPSPFCLLDEVDAPLDDANIDRFNAFVKELSLMSQFILITHNKKTMEMAGTLHGITMEEPGVSKTISVRF